MSSSSALGAAMSILNDYPVYGWLVYRTILSERFVTVAVRADTTPEVEVLICIKGTSTLWDVINDTRGMGSSAPVLYGSVVYTGFLSSMLDMVNSITSPLVFTRTSSPDTMMGAFHSWVQDQVSLLSGGRTPKSITCCGHSLGGAIAQMLAWNYECWTTNPQYGMYIGFGAPSPWYGSPNCPDHSGEWNRYCTRAKVQPARDPLRPNRKVRPQWIQDIVSEYPSGSVHHGVVQYLNTKALDDRISGTFLHPRRLYYLHIMETYYATALAMKII
jgi:pimeloyl-ACP methyl ester carboxylesterase